MTAASGKAEGGAELLPCPFCGKPETVTVLSSFDLYDDDSGNEECFAVLCDAGKPGGKGGCGASGGFYPSRQEATAAWNRRAHLATPAANGPGRH